MLSQFLVLMALAELPRIGIEADCPTGRSPHKWPYDPSRFYTMSEYASALLVRLPSAVKAGWVRSLAHAMRFCSLSFAVAQGPASDLDAKETSKKRVDRFCTAAGAYRGGSRRGVSCLGRLACYTRYHITSLQVTAQPHGQHRHSTSVSSLSVSMPAYVESAGAREG